MPNKSCVLRKSHPFHPVGTILLFPIRIIAYSKLTLLQTLLSCIIYHDDVYDDGSLKEAGLKADLGPRRSLKPHELCVDSPGLVPSMHPAS